MMDFKFNRPASLEQQALNEEGLALAQANKSDIDYIAMVAEITLTESTDEEDTPNEQ